MRSILLAGGSGIRLHSATLATSRPQAATFVPGAQERQGPRLACLEEIAWRRGFLDAPRLRSAAARLGRTDYGRYLLQIADEA